MQDVKLDEATGELIHKHFMLEDGTPRRFKNQEVFDKWFDSQRSKMLKHYKERLTPHQYWVTQECGTERPFLNFMCENMQVGHYSCLVCSQNLFLFEHKYINKSGFPTFWNSLKHAISFHDDHLEVPDPSNCVVDPVL